MKDTQAFRHFSLVMNHPSYAVGQDWNMRTEHSTVSLGAYSPSPNPAIVWSFRFYLRQKETLKWIRQYLIKNFRKDRFRLHQSVVLIVCHAFGCFNSARASLF